MTSECKAGYLMFILKFHNTEVQKMCVIAKYVSSIVLICKLIKMSLPPYNIIDHINNAMSRTKHDAQDKAQYLTAVKV